MVDGRSVVATGPSISQLTSATKEIFQSGFLTSSLEKINGERLSQ